MTKATTTTRATAEELYTTAEKAVYIALRARHEKSGLHFLAELQNAQYTDKQCRNNIAIIERLDPLEKSLAEQREKLQSLAKLKAFADRQSLSLKYTSNIRREWATRTAELTEYINILKTHIKHLADEIDTLYRALNITFTDRADLTQTAILKILELEQMTEEELFEELGFTDNDIFKWCKKNNIDPQTLYDEEWESYHPNKEQCTEIWADIKFRAVINTVGKAINTVATPEALNSHKTKSRKATEEEIQEWLSIHGGHGEQYKEYVSRKRCRMSDCYRTLEHKDTKTMKGFYIVTHYKTVAPYQYIEDYSPTDENGENDIAYIKSYNPIATDYADIEGISELCDNANLSDTERLILEYYTRALRFYTTKEDILKYISNATKISTRTVYRRIEAIKTALTPIAEEKHIISKSKSRRKGA